MVPSITRSYQFQQGNPQMWKRLGFCPNQLHPPPLVGTKLQLFLHIAFEGIVAPLKEGGKTHEPKSTTTTTTTTTPLTSPPPSSHWMDSSSTELAIASRRAMASLLLGLKNSCFLAKIFVRIIFSRCRNFPLIQMQFSANL